jgi:hypothetical protein
VYLVYFVVSTESSRLKVELQTMVAWWCSQGPVAQIQIGLSGVLWPCCQVWAVSPPFDNGGYEDFHFSDSLSAAW